MLEEIIKNELIKFSEDISRQANPEVTAADRAIAAVMDKVNKSDSSLGDELETATDLLMISYGDMYFAEGFKVALRLVKEMNKVN